MTKFFFFFVSHLFFSDSERGLTLRPQQTTRYSLCFQWNLHAFVLLNYLTCESLSPSLPLSLSHTHTHTHTDFPLPFQHHHIVHSKPSLSLSSCRCSRLAVSRVLMIFSDKFHPMFFQPSLWHHQQVRISLVNVTRFKDNFSIQLLVIIGCTNNVPAPSLCSNSSKADSWNGWSLKIFGQTCPSLFSFFTLLYF